MNMLLLIVSTDEAPKFFILRDPKADLQIALENIHNLHPEEDDLTEIQETSLDMVEKQIFENSAFMAASVTANEARKLEDVDQLIVLLRP